MSPLAARLAARIGAEGPIGLDAFWNEALFDPAHGYYTAGTPLGAAGDFTTAPEISQMFGELVGVWCLAAWRALRGPAPFVLAEIGGGRGTLLADLLRTVRRLDPGFLQAARLRLVEVSDRLAGDQLAAAARFDLPARRVRRVEELEPMPLVIVGNELFDALPVRQFVRRAGHWRERLVDLAATGGGPGFAFAEGPPGPAETPPGFPPPAEGDVMELSPARLAAAAAIAVRLARHGGAGLFLDYGHWRPGFGDTLQALARHAAADPLEAPGTRDITAHVDFAALAGVFARAGLAVAPPATQGDLLLSLGLLERAGALGAGLDEAGRAGVRAAVERLAGSAPGGMGTLFKVLAIASRPLPLAPFAAATTGD